MNAFFVSSAAAQAYLSRRRKALEILRYAGTDREALQKNA